MTQQESKLVPRRIVRGAECVPSGRTYTLDDTPEVRSAIEEYRRDVARASKFWPRWAVLAICTACAVLLSSVLMSGFDLFFVSKPWLLIPVVAVFGILSLFLLFLDQDRRRRRRRGRIIEGVERFESTPGVTPVPEMFLEMAVPTSLYGADPAQVLHAAVSRGERAVIRAAICRMKEEHDIERGLDPQIIRGGDSDRIVDELVDHVKRASGQEGARASKRRGLRRWARA